MECGVCRVWCVYSVECGGVWSVECKVWSVECAVSKVWIVECGV